MDATWSVRIPEDMKERISNMITESGLNSKEFLTQVIQAYELKAAKELQPLMESDIDELTQIIARIHNIFINLCERITNFQKQKDEEFELKFNEKDEMVSVFNSRIKMYEEKIVKHEQEAEQFKEQYKNICEQYANLDEVNAANKALVLEYREKNETLTGLLVEYKEYKSMIDSIRKQLEEEKEARQSAELKLLENDKEKSCLNNQLTESKKVYQAELAYKLGLQEIQKEKEILEIKKICQGTLESTQKAYTTKVQELLGMIEEQKTLKTTKKNITKSSTTPKKS